MKCLADCRRQATLRWQELVKFLALGAVLWVLPTQAIGTGTLDRVSGWYPLGTNLTVHALPGTNSVFNAWLGNTNGAVMVGSQITLAVNGSLSVTGLFSTLQFTNHQWVRIQSISISGKTVTLNVTNRTPNGGWVLLQSTNLLLPLSQWPTNRTGLYDGNGILNTNLLNTVISPSAFFILK